MKPVDLTTGLPCGIDTPEIPGTVEVLVGYLVTFPDGHECRLGPDRTRAEIYAAKQHATLEPTFVIRPTLQKPRGT